MIRADSGSEFENCISDLVVTGRSNSKRDVLREGVRLIQERESEMAALDAVIERSVADSLARRGKPVQAVFERLVARYQAMASERKGR